MALHQPSVRQSSGWIQPLNGVKDWWMDDWTTPWEEEDFILESKASRHWQWTENIPKTRGGCLKILHHLLQSALQDLKKYRQTKRAPFECEQCGICISLSWRPTSLCLFTHFHLSENPVLWFLSRTGANEGGWRSPSLNPLSTSSSPQCNDDHEETR